MSRISEAQGQGKVIGEGAGPGVQRPLAGELVTSLLAVSDGPCPES